MKTAEIEKIIDDLVKEVNSPLAKKWATVGFRAGIKIAKEYHNQKLAEMMPNDETLSKQKMFFISQKGDSGYSGRELGCYCDGIIKGIEIFKSLLTQEEK